MPADSVTSSTTDYFFLLSRLSAVIGAVMYTVPFWVPVLFSKRKRDIDAKYAALRGDID